MIARADGITLALAALAGFSGLAMLLFPGLFKKMSDAEYENSPHSGLWPKSTRIGSKGSYRLFGLGMLVVAGIIAYYGFTMP